MASNYTENYGLCQWEATDQVLREEFNQDNAKIDAALEAKGNCRIVSGTYVGSGQGDMNHPIHLDFGNPPLFLVITDNYTWMILVRGSTYAYAYKDTSTSRNKVVWTDGGVEWSCSNSFQNAENMLDEEGTTYYYVALL